MNTITRNQELTVEEKAYLSFVRNCCKFKMPYILKVGDKIDLFSCLTSDVIGNLPLPERLRGFFHCEDDDGLLLCNNGVISVNEDKVTDTNFEKQITVYLFDGDYVIASDEVIITNKKFVEFIPLQEKDGMLSVMVINPMQHDIIVNSYMHIIYRDSESVILPHVPDIPCETVVNYPGFDTENFQVTAETGVIIRANHYAIIDFSLQNVTKKSEDCSYLFVYADDELPNNAFEFCKDRPRLLIK